MSPQDGRLILRTASNVLCGILHVEGLVALKGGVLLVTIIALSACQGPKRSEIVLEPGTPALEQVYQEGRAAYQNGQFDDAAEKFARVAGADEEHLNALINWGVALSRSGKLLEAIPKFQQVLARAPEKAEAYYNWGVVLERLGKHQEAVEKYEQALTRNAELLTPALKRYLQRHRLHQQETQIGAPSPPPAPSR